MLYFLLNFDPTMLKFGLSIDETSTCDPKYRLNFMNTNLTPKLDEPFSINFNAIFGLD